MRDPQLDPRDFHKYLKEQVNDINLLIKALRDFNNKYRFPPLLWLQDGSPRRFDLVSPVQGLEVLLSLVKPAADALDRGGKPTMVVFQTLAKGLIRAYRHATGELGTGKPALEGGLHDLVEAVLPTASKHVRSLTGEPLEVPKDLGQYLNRTAKRLPTVKTLPIPGQGL
jgi:hypothetical protein